MKCHGPELALEGLVLDLIWSSVVLGCALTVANAPAPSGNFHGQGSHLVG